MRVCVSWKVSKYTSNIEAHINKYNAHYGSTAQDCTSYLEDKVAKLEYSVNNLAILTSVASRVSINR